MTVVAYALHMRTLRMKACFNLYRVRDDFVLLAAKGVLPEDSQPFKHYYGRINSLLKTAPKVGVDDLLEVMFRKMSPGDFDQVLERAKRNAQQMQADPLMKNAEVRAAVADYYRALNLLILSHSSIVKILYLVSHRLTTIHLPNFVLRGEWRRAVRAADYANEEARIFQHGT